MSFFSKVSIHNKHQAPIDESWQLVAYFSSWHCLYGELSVPRVLHWGECHIHAGRFFPTLGSTWIPFYVFAMMLYAFTPCFVLTDLQLHATCKFSIMPFPYVMFQYFVLFATPKHFVQIYISLSWPYVLFYICVVPSVTLTIPPVCFLCGVLCPCLKGSTIVLDLYLLVLHPSHKTMAAPYEDEKEWKELAN